MGDCFAVTVLADFGSVTIKTVKTAKEFGRELMDEQPTGAAKKTAL